MPLLATYSALLLLAVLVSQLAHRSILSTAVLFLAGGVILGQGVTDLLSVDAQGILLSELVKITLFAVLFTDGMHVGLRELRAAWHLPGRALLLGMPLTMLLTGLAAHWLAGLAWSHAFLIGAVLSPTDPVFASALIGNHRVPLRLQRLLNVESGINDGLALPVVIVLLEVAAHSDSTPLTTLAIEVTGGLVLGIAIPWAAITLERSRFFKSSPAYEPLNAFAIGLLVYAVTRLLHQNEFLGAFAAGVTVATMSEPVKEAFHKFGELVAELLKLASLLLFGILFSIEMLGETSQGEWLFVLAALALIRPVALMLSLLGSSMSIHERLVASWFGPKGFASVAYGLLILKSGLEAAPQMFHLVALTVAASIVAHSSTDVLVSKSFPDQTPEQAV